MSSGFRNIPKDDCIDPALRRGFVYHPEFGWIEPNTLIVDTINPIPGAIEFVSNPTSDNFPLVPGSSEMIDQLLQVFCDQFGVAVSAAIDTEYPARICPCAPRYWKIKIQETIGDVLDENLPTGQGSAGGSTREEEKFRYYPNNQLLDIEKKVPLDAVSESLDLPDDLTRRKVFVGIVERGTLGESGGPHHVDSVASIVRVDGLVTPVVLSTTATTQDQSTVFDLICVLNDKCKLQHVDIVNISQGYYSSVVNHALYDTLLRIKKPIVCSAGNCGKDNDEFGHWPSNFALWLPQMISVAALNQEQDEIDLQYSNYGKATVTLAATGTFSGAGGATISGTSFASPLVARMIALMHVVVGDHLKFPEIIDFLDVSLLSSSRLNVLHLATNKMTAGSVAFQTNTGYRVIDF